MRFGRSALSLIHEVNRPRADYSKSNIESNNPLTVYTRILDEINIIVLLNYAPEETLQKFPYNDILLNHILWLI